MFGGKRRSYASVFVTGASSGIGRALCVELARRGAKVAAFARRKELLDALAAEIAAVGGTCLAIAGDATRDADLRAALEAAATAHGPLDLVVANAGVGRSGLVRDLPPDTARRTLELNAIGAVATVELALPAMIARGAGQVAIVSSLASLKGLPGGAVYSASKACVSAYCEALSGEVRPLGVVVTCVCPGFVDTPMIADQPMAKMVWKADRAARVIVDQLSLGRRWIGFPWSTKTALKLARWLPAPIFERLALAAIKRGQRSAEQARR